MFPETTIKEESNNAAKYCFEGSPRTSSISKRINNAIKVNLDKLLWKVASFTEVCEFTLKVKLLLMLIKASIK